MNKTVNLEEYVKSIFRGVGQVMLQNNALTGLIFLAGIIYASWLMGIGALIGTTIGTLSAILFKYDKQNIKDGLYGFNGTLVGIALLYFFKPSTLLFIIIIVASILSTIIMNYMYNKNLSPYTFPFVLITWIFIFLIKILDVVTSSVSTNLVFTNLNLLSGISMGFGQVMFQASIVTGALFFIGILINSRISATYALLGSVVGLILGSLFFPSSLTLINIGIFGFNGVLCGVALSGKKLKNIIYAIIAIILSVGILYCFMELNLISLTAPFVFATWITIIIKNRLENKKNNKQTKQQKRKNFKREK